MAGFRVAILFYNQMNYLYSGRKIMRSKGVLAVLALILLYCHVAQASLILHLGFEDTLNDSSAYHNNAVLNSGATASFSTDKPAVIAGAKSVFIPRTDCIKVPNSLSLVTSDTVTVAFWAKVSDINTTDNGYDSLVVKMQSAAPGVQARGFRLRQEVHNDRMKLRIDTGATTNQVVGVIDGVYPASNPTWHHIAFILDKGKFTCYKDGASVSTGTYTHNDGFATDLGLGDLLIGGDSNPVAPQVEGYFDDFAMWDSDIGAAAIAGLASGAYTPETIPLLNACNITLDAGAPQGTISTKITGVNTVYQKESDAYWSGTKYENFLKDMKCGLIRWPGGEVTSYYHWNDMISRGQADTWDPKFDGNKGSGSSFMNLDEYMTHVAAIGCEPMVGINMESGAAYNRDADGVNEAKALLQYCKTKNYNVKKWFLDNEPYISASSNHVQMTVTQYANYLNMYGDALRSVDPNIELVANWNSYWASGWQTLLNTAGRNVDIMDNHFYWAHGQADWNLWLSQTPMTHWAGSGNPRKSYDAIIKEEKTQAAKAGYPNMKIATFEWNIGPTSTTNPSQFQAALMQAEQFGQFINGGLDYGTFWPAHGYDEYRQIFNSSSATPHPNFEMFKMYSSLLGQQLIKTTTDQTSIRPVAALSQDGNTLWVCLVRKSNDAPDQEVALNLSGFIVGSATVSNFNSSNILSNTYTMTNLAPKSLRPFRVDIPAHSFTKITLTRLQSSSKTWEKFR